jgi:hypothetical protein
MTDLASADMVALLEDGPLRSFRDWPPAELPAGPSGVYTVWRGTSFLYVGMSWAHRVDGVTDKARGVFGRLASHASGRRSGDQFCIYICDRYVIPRLTAADMEALANGERILDRRTKQFIAEHLDYRVAPTSSGAEARAIEAAVRRNGLARAGRPIINP